MKAVIYQCFFLHDSICMTVPLIFSLQDRIFFPNFRNYVDNLDLMKFSVVIKVVFCFEAFLTFYSTIVRSNHLRCSRKKALLKNFAKFTGKHLWQLYLKKDSGAGVFL